MSPTAFQQQNDLITSVLKLFFNLLSIRKLASLWLFLLPALSLGQAITDSLGNKVVLDKKYNRILSSSLGSDVILFDLLKDSKPPRLIGISKLAYDKKYSPIHEIVPKSMMFSYSMEELASKSPDLVILASYTNADIKHLLKKLNIKYFVLDKFSSLEHIKENIKTIGKLVSESDKANKLIKDLNKELNAIKSCTKNSKKHKNPPLVANFSPDNTLIGQNTTYNDIVEYAGFINVGKKLNLSGWPKVGDEVIASLNPDYVIINGAEGSEKTLKKQLKSSLVWKDLNAVKNNRIIFVPTRYFSSVSHKISKAIRILHEKAYGECK